MLGSLGVSVLVLVVPCLRGKLNQLAIELLGNVHYVYSKTMNFWAIFKVSGHNFAMHEKAVYWNSIDDNHGCGQIGITKGKVIIDVLDRYIQKG
jgi:hypothetical protein